MPGTKSTGLRPGELDISQRRQLPPDHGDGAGRHWFGDRLAGAVGPHDSIAGTDEHAGLVAAQVPLPPPRRQRDGLAVGHATLVDGIDARPAHAVVGTCHDQGGGAGSVEADAQDDLVRVVELGLDGCDLVSRLRPGEKGPTRHILL